jgi:hypothetical protein
MADVVVYDKPSKIKTLKNDLSIIDFIKKPHITNSSIDTIDINENTEAIVINLKAISAHSFYNNNLDKMMKNARKNGIDVYVINELSQKIIETNYNISEGIHYTNYFQK